MVGRLVVVSLLLCWPTLLGILIIHYLLCCWYEEAQKNSENLSQSPNNSTQEQSPGLSLWNVIRRG